MKRKGEDRARSSFLERVLERLVGGTRGEPATDPPDDEFTARVVRHIGADGVDFQSQILRGRSMEIEVDGVDVLHSVRYQVGAEKKLVVSILSSNSPRDQGVLVSSRSRVSIDGEELGGKIVRWADGQRDRFVVTLTPNARGKFKNQVAIVNCYEFEHPDGRIGTWYATAWAGIQRVEMTDTRSRYYCSDGLGGPDFHNLVFEVEVVDRE